MSAETETLTKEWVRISSGPSGTLATVTLQEGNISVKWTVKTYASTLKDGVATARTGAQRALSELREALA